MQTVVLKLEGISCGHCVHSIESAVKQAGGFGKVDLNTQSVTVEFDDLKISLDKIKIAIEEQGYEIIE
jgi:copper chaperone